MAAHITPQGRMEPRSRGRLSLVSDHLAGWKPLELSWPPSSMCLCVSAGNLTSGSHACKESPWPTEPSPPLVPLLLGDLETKHAALLTPSTRLPLSYTPSLGYLPPMTQRAAGELSTQ